MGPGAPGARIEANLAALRLLKSLDGRPASAEDQKVLARWSAWGAVPGVFDETRTEYAPVREELQALLSEAEYVAARRTVVNAHYTDAHVAEAMWEAVQGLGVDTGLALEPGAGSGTFMGLAPDGVQVLGVELDPLTAGIAAALYPGHSVRAESFADTTLEPGSFDLAIGNVPFGDVRLHDPLHNPGRRHSIHNHFILKSLDLTRPGGLVAVLTSRFTMDSTGTAARRAMHERADLVTTVRLPTGAHLESAGTEAVTDLLIFRKRPEGAPVPRFGSWIDVVDVELPLRGQPGAEEIALNAWWDERPECVLGSMTLGSGMYGAQTLHVAGEGDTAAALRTVLAAEVEHALSVGLGATPAPTAMSAESRSAALAGQPRVLARAGDPARFPGFLSHDASTGTFSALTAYGTSEPVVVSRADTPRLAQLLAIRDAQLQLLALEGASEADTPETDQARTVLNDRYDVYLRRWGPINQVTLSTSSRLDRDGEPITSRRYPSVMRALRCDPFAGAVMGLEHYDEETGVAEKAAIFERRVVQARPVVSSVESPEDACAVSLDRLGRVDVDLVAGLLDVDVDEARRQITGLVFEDPTSGRLVPRAEYLSGNVRKALAAAEDAAAERPELLDNVTALRAVQPTDLAPGEIKAQLGAVWIDAATVSEFATQVLHDQRLTVEHLGGSEWHVRNGNKYSARATQTWGTGRLSAPDLLEKLLRQEAVLVYDTHTDHEGRKQRVLNTTETAAAQDKAEQLSEQFSDWVWEDPERAARLSRVYNDRFNAIVLRDYSVEGQRLTLPGLSATFTPHPHQRAAVARMLAEPSVGLFHAVGAGKTAEMVMGAMELRRLGMVNKPCVAVPNHMLDQVTREWLQLYPRAKVLAASSADLAGPSRAAFIGRAAMGDWDGVILTHGALHTLKMSVQTESDYVAAEVERTRDTLERARAAGVSSQTLKSVEKAIMRKEAKLAERLAKPGDPGLTFEQTGIDYLIVDELHLFKNLEIDSRIEGVSGNGSQRAQRLDMKITWLRERAEERAAAHPGAVARVVTGATATPIANSVSEAYVMQHYLRPDILLEAGITDFDSWAATFGSVVTDLEMRPDGTYGPKTRFARFDNLPELLRMWHVSADVCSAEQLGLKTPALTVGADGHRGPQTVVVPATPELERFMASLVERAEKLRNAGRARKGADNMLVVTSDGRKAALDMRMLDRTRTDSMTTGLDKVDVIAERVVQIWERTRHNRYLDHDSGQPHPTPGALQVVFADLGTPNPDPEKAWSFYTQLRDHLAAAGIPAHHVRFMQDANTDAKKARLFADARAGKVAVLIGSTSTMGVGTNVQTRTVALHHVDCPWRPADVEQRDGRGVRQGNQNEEIEVIRYVTERSFDAFSWQTVERKARFIQQLMHGSLTARGAEDIAGNQALSFAQVKALASGEPLLLKRAETEQRIKQLERLEVAHQRNQAQRRHTITSQERHIAELSEALPRLERLMAARTPTEGDAFSCVIAGRRHTTRTAAAEALGGVVAPALKAAKALPPAVAAPAGDLVLGGVPMRVEVRHTLGAAEVRVMVDEQVQFVLDARAVTAASVGPITRIENRVAGLEGVVADVKSRMSAAERDRAEAALQLGAEFPHKETLAKARRRLTRLDQALSRKHKGPEDGGAAAATPPDPTLARHDASARTPPTGGYLRARRSVVAPPLSPPPPPPPSLGVDL